MTSLNYQAECQGNKVQVPIGLPPKIVAVIDKKRGAITRSRYLRDWIVAEIKKEMPSILEETLA